MQEGARTYPGNIEVGASPTCSPNGVDVHSHTPPFEPLPPLWLTPAVALSDENPHVNQLDHKKSKSYVPDSRDGMPVPEARVRALFVRHLVRVQEEAQLRLGRDAPAFAPCVYDHIVVGRQDGPVLRDGERDRFMEREDLGAVNRRAVKKCRRR